MSSLDELLRDIEAVRAEIDAAPAATPDEAEAFRIRFLGRKSGLVTGLFGRMGQMPPEARRDAGQALNAIKLYAEERLEAAQAATAGAARPSAAGIDLTLPGRIPAPAEPGSLHPITQTLNEITRIFGALGFTVEEGPEIEDDWHNFTALNFPPEHPARDMQDTLFLASPVDPASIGAVMRTHTSPVQIRVMESRKPPIRIVAPGRVYRNEAISYKSFCLFHQVEGLYVDEHVTFADLKEILRVFAETFFGEGVRMRFRPSFFPFTETSAEVDIWWADERFEGGGRWLEILGCGMVDPNVLANCGIDPERYSGYAFGMGVERPAMLRHGIDDIRLFYENDVRFLKQF